MHTAFSKAGRSGLLRDKTYATSHARRKEHSN
jgi:hypothetical protein